ncbi:MAG TPA: acetyltransferase, partial [Deinococcales bacterium]|nr:acetyltransferase [Deinococcales bacterium]
MPWLTPQPVPNDADATYASFLQDLDARLSDDSTDRDRLARELLAQFLYGRSYEQVLADAPLAALNLDPRNITLEA